jgi:glucose-1-phosphate cytidylyltransferase
MKTVILAGGMGTRITEETSVRPKPLVEIGGMPILWHIMKHYSSHGLDDFVVCLGYKGYMIKEFFANYYLHSCDVTFDIAGGSMEVHQSRAEPWRVTLVDTGEATQTGGRLKRVLPHLGDDDFCLTYGDGLSDIDIGALVDFHRREGREATVTAVQPPGRFGALRTDGPAVQGFAEKPTGDGGWINGGFFVLSPSVGGRIEGDATVWEREPLEGLARDGQLSAYRHDGFWQAMDTMRERNHLQQLWESGEAPWRTWE